jgi:hypothetical protein
MAEHHVMMEERSIAIDERILKNNQEQKLVSMKPNDLEKKGLHILSLCVIRSWHLT